MAASGLPIVVTCITACSAAMYSIVILVRLHEQAGALVPYTDNHIKISDTVKDIILCVICVIGNGYEACNIPCVQIAEADLRSLANAVF